MSSEIIGRITCRAGNRATVQQTKRKGSHFALKCTCCGFNQGTGREHQQWIWDTAEWFGDPPPPPVNVIPNLRDAQTETATEEVTDRQTDFDPLSEMDETEPETEKRSGKGIMLAGLGLAAGFIAAIASA